MPDVRSVAVLPEVLTLFSVGSMGRLTDRQLLDRFATCRGERSEQAFAALVERHGPMVLRVCGSILRDPSDVDDAFQATFLVLARRKPGTLWVRDSIGPWLYQVACRVATRVLSDSARRRRHEQRAAERAPAAMVDLAFDDVGPTVHEEVARLPERYRAPLVLCYLEGLTHEQAAEHLGWPLGTVRSRLARGRERLRGRLERRGVVSASPLVGLLADRAPAVSRTLVTTTARAAMSASQTAAATLSVQVAHAILWSRLVRLVASVLVVALAAAGSLGAVAYRARASHAATGPAGRPRQQASASRARTVAPRTAAEQLAETLLKSGSDLFDAKDAQALAASYTEDGEVHFIDRQDGQYKDEVKRGRAEVEQLYRDMFRDAGSIDSENMVDFAQLVAPDVLVIHGRFRPNAGESETPFVQTRIKQGDVWRIRKILLFLSRQ